MFQHLAMQGTWTVFWADYLHKLARKSAMALSASSSDQFLKKMNKLFRLTRRPYGSAKFGKQLLTARETLMEAIKKHEVDSMLDTWLPGCAKDNGRLDVTSSLQVCDTYKNMYWQFHKKLLDVA